jgi:hypothetical protein
LSVSSLWAIGVCPEKQLRIYLKASSAAYDREKDADHVMDDGRDASTPD